MQVEDVGALGGVVRAQDERGGRVRHVQKICRAAEANMERQAEHRRFHRLRGVARESRVPVDAVDGERPQPHARETGVEKVDARVALVRALEHAVVRRRLARRGLVDGRAVVAHTVDGGRAGVDDPLDPEGAARLEYVQGAAS